MPTGDGESLLYTGKSIYCKKWRIIGQLKGVWQAQREPQSNDGAHHRHQEEE